MRRDVSSEITVAVAALGILAFAIVFGIILSLTSVDPQVPTDVVQLVTATEDSAQTTEPIHSPTNRIVTVTATHAVESMTEDEGTYTATATASPTETAEAVVIVPTDTEAPSATATETASVTPTASITASATATATPTAEPTTTATTTVKPTTTATTTATPTDTATSVPTVTAIPTDTATSAPTVTATPTASETTVPTATATSTAIPTGTVLPTATSTAIPTVTVMVALVATDSLADVPVVASVEYVQQDIGILPTPTAFAPRNRTDCTRPSGWEAYTVERGNTLFAIAQATGSTVGELRDANCLENIDNIYSGTRLLVPRLPLEPVDSISPNPLSSNDPNNLHTAGCSDTRTRITQPGAGATINGVFTVFGTAAVDNLQYYKIEIRPDQSDMYHFYDRYESSVADGALAQVNAGLFNDGVYWVRLTVVDHTGNYPPPCDIPLIFQTGSR